MFSHSLIITLILACCAVLSPVNADSDRIVFHTLKTLALARMDPIISPGNMSQQWVKLSFFILWLTGMSHSPSSSSFAFLASSYSLHHVVGASGFNQNYDPVKLRKSQCTSLGVQADLSNYWQPAVMKVLNDGTYASMRTNTRIYYHFRRLLTLPTRVSSFFSFSLECRYRYWLILFYCSSKIV